MNVIIKKRILAYLIDGVILITPLQITAFLVWDITLKNYIENLLVIAFAFQFLPFILYFMISEFFFSKTVGKKVMNLTVVFEKDILSSVAIRTFARLIPLELLSFFFYDDKLLHDVLSNTKVIKRK